MERMTLLTPEAAYRFHERMGLTIGAAHPTEDLHADLIGKAVRWQHKNDRDTPRTVRVEDWKSKILPAE